MPRLTRSFFARDPITVARALLGQHLVHDIDGITRSAMIVETEAYVGAIDAAAHTHLHHRSKRVESMYAKPGSAYVFFTYGIHHMLNISTTKLNVPDAILIRAAEPLDGLELMRSARGSRHAFNGKDRDLCNGPGKLAQAMGITVTAHNGLDLVTDAALYLTQGQRISDDAIETTSRIGVAYAVTETENWAAAPLRYLIKGHPCVSKGPREPTGSMPRPYPGMA